jgi:hypothetical protein
VWKVTSLHDPLRHSLVSSNKLLYFPSMIHAFEPVFMGNIGTDLKTVKKKTDPCFIHHCGNNSCQSCIWPSSTTLLNTIGTHSLLGLEHGGDSESCRLSEKSSVSSSLSQVWYCKRNRGFAVAWYRHITIYFSPPLVGSNSTWTCIYMFGYAKSLTWFLLLISLQVQVNLQNGTSFWAHSTTRQRLLSKLWY